MEAKKEYWLQRETKGGEWRDIVKSYEYSGLIGAGMIRYQERGDICRVVDKAAKEVIWHAKGVLMYKNAPGHNG